MNLSYSSKIKSYLAVKGCLYVDYLQMYFSEVVYFHCC